MKLADTSPLMMLYIGSMMDRIAKACYQACSGLAVVVLSMAVYFYFQSDQASQVVAIGMLCLAVTIWLTGLAIRYILVNR